MRQHKKYKNNRTNQNQVIKISHSQNFLKKESLVEKLVGLADLNPDDHILEIGSGNGIITKQLSHRVRKVTTIEIDPELISLLKTELSNIENTENIEIIHSDILKYIFPKSEYKIFANIPFNITAEIMLKILHSKTHPTSSWIIMQKEVADKFIGKNYSTESHILFAPWFEFQILTNINRFEYSPVPSVNTVLLFMKTKEKPLLEIAKLNEYEKFVNHGFRSWKINLQKGMAKHFTYTQWKRLSKDGGFNLKALPSELNANKWIRLFEFYLSF